MIYVDALRPAPWRYKKSCHLFADTSAELHAFATRIGLRREWAQKEGTPTEHYDLTQTRRALAVESGAKEIGYRELANLIKAKRKAEASA